MSHHLNVLVIGGGTGGIKENWSMWILKKYGLPYLYWNRMMKGKM